MPSRARTHSSARRVDVVLLAVAGLGVLATAFVRWVARGAGSTFTGLELADALRSNVLVSDAGGPIAAGMYVTVASGGALLASSGFAGRTVAIVRLGGSAAVAGAFLVAAGTGWFPLDRWSWGPYVVVIAAAVAAAVSVRQVRDLARESSRPEA